MNGYSLVIDISDEENTRTSTPIKTLPLNLIRTLNISDSSTEVYRGSDAELETTGESLCSPKRAKLTPQKKKKTKVSFNLPPVIRQPRSSTKQGYRKRRLFIESKLNKSIQSVEIKASYLSRRKTPY